MQEKDLQMLFKEKPIFKFALREDLKGEKQFLPTRATNKATGWDVRAAQNNKEDIILYPFDKILIPLGFRVFCPEGWWLEIKPRSSSFTKKHLNCLYGTIDCDFEGQMMFACQYLPPLKLERNYEGLVYSSVELDQALIIPYGEAIAQIIPIKREEMIVEETINEEYDLFCQQRQGERGIGGFGSTDGKK